MVKYNQKLHNFILPIYKSLFLHVNLKLVLFALNFQSIVFSLISILVDTLWSSRSFVKYTLQNSLKNSLGRH